MPTKFDQLSLQVLCQLLATFMPIAKLAKEDSYLIGTEAKQMIVRGDKCMVRVGGGYADIKDYYNKYAIKQCVSLYQRIKSSNSTFKKTIVELLEKNKAAPEVINAYLAKSASWVATDYLFKLLSNLVEVKTNKSKRQMDSSAKHQKRKSTAASSEDAD